ncbi:MAG: carbon storage regulator [Halanaerobiales bacterium]|nr:carbon storage regulator [Halanaerobiales bacterium]
MLILTRKKDESIIINDEIKIIIIEIDNNRVQLGIEAPKSVMIHREEVYQEIQKENLLAANKKSKLPSDFADLLKKRVKRVKEEEKQR